MSERFGDTRITYNKRKDETPEITVQTIEDCLARIGLRCGYTFYEQDVQDCYSARVYLEGGLSGAIAANGKGTTRAYCLASGFAELMERIQNQIFVCQVQPSDPLAPYTVNKPSADSLCRVVSLEAMRADPDSFLNRVIGRYVETMDCQSYEFHREQLVLLQFKKLFPLWDRDGIVTMPFYHVQKKTYEWLPVELIKSLNMSNGMAAGNTLEEALVQGYSELMERYVQRQIIENNITPPEIDREELEQYPYIRKVIHRIESAGPYRVRILDCSLGEGFPVVCGMVINQKEQSFGVRFGAHPDMQIAMERVFTEALQGKKLEEFTRINQISYERHRVMTQQNLFNTMKTGVGYYPAGLFEGKPCYAHTAWPLKEDEVNRDLVVRMTETILAKTSRLYILDVSYLGFPSVCIYAEGMSEIIPCSYTVLKNNALKRQAASFLRDVACMDEKKAERFLTVGKLIRNSVLENTIDAMCEMPFSYPFHGGNDQIGFLMAVCCFYLGDYTGARKKLMECMNRNEKGTEEYRYEAALYKLISGREAGAPQGLMQKTLALLCGEETAAAVCRDFSERSRVFERLYPECRQFQCERCSHTGCAYRELREFCGKIYQCLLKTGVMTEKLHLIFSCQPEQQ